MIELRDIAIRQGRFHLDGIALLVPRGHYAMFMGPTGSGKSTLLEVIAGLRRPAAGHVLLGGRPVTTLDPAERDIGYVPQDGALFRTMTVRQNLGFALAIRGRPESAIRARVNELAAWLGLEHLLERRAVGLSGGETQRIALGRALAHGPPVLLMDEPLASLDEETRERLIGVFQTIRSRYDVTVLHVSHSRHEAERLGDLVLRLQDGRIETITYSPLPSAGDGPAVRGQIVQGPPPHPRPLSPRGDRGEEH